MDDYGIKEGNALNEFWTSFANGARIAADEAIITEYNKGLRANHLNIAGRLLAEIGREATIEDLLNAIEWQIRPHAYERNKLSAIRTAINSTRFLLASDNEFEHLKCGEDEAIFISVWNELKPIFKESLKKDVQLFNTLMVALSIIELC